MNRNILMIVIMFNFMANVFGMESNQKKEFYSLALVGNGPSILRSFQYTNEKNEKTYQEVSKVYGSDLSARTLWRLCNTSQPFNIRIKNSDQKYRVTEVTEEHKPYSMNFMKYIYYNLDKQVSDDCVESIELSFDPVDDPQESSIIAIIKRASIPLGIAFALYYYQNHPMMATFFENALG